MLNKSDILNYFDFKYIADYKKIPKNKIPGKNGNISMKEFLKKNNIRLTSKEIEDLAEFIPRVPKELMDKVISFIKLSLIDFNK